MAVVVGTACDQQPAKPGMFSATGSMMSARWLHTATLLPSGNVLLAGGYAGTDPLSSSDLYDPAGNAFAPTATMTLPRALHTATLLPSGRVLIAGGMNIASAELYDPASGTFAATGTMTEARCGHSATLLATGKVLVVGGCLLESASAELYDPASATFGATGSMVTARAGGHSATLLKSGKVLVTGGTSDNISYSASAELYDPTTETFTAINAMIAARAYHTAVLLPSGRVLIVGGQGVPQGGITSETLSSAELYDPASETFTSTGAMIASRMRHAGTLLPDGKVLVVGGLDVPPAGAAQTTLSSAELYDPASETFTSTGSLMVAREGLTATLLRTGSVLVAGGADVGSDTFASAELYY